MNDLKLYEKLPWEVFPIRLSKKPCKVYFEAHWHEYTEIHFVRRGSMNIGYNGKKSLLKEGECAIVNANELHQGNGNPCEDLVIMIHPSFFENMNILFKSFVKDDFVSELIIKIFDEYEEGLYGADYAIKGYTYQLISHLMRNHSASQLTEISSEKISSKYSTVNEILKYINTNYYENITTQLLAETVHLSQSHFCHIFKEVTGKTAKEYLIEIRIKKAAELLAGTNMNMTEIAFSCGFSDANYFARVFKRLFNMMPTEYKNKTRQKLTL